MKNFNKERIIFISCSLIFFIANLDSTIVSSVLPVIAKEYQVNVLSLNVLIIFFMVAYALAILFVDFLVISYGVKTVFLIACIAFAISSLGCGLVNSINGLVIMRTLQGVSAGFFTPIARSITVKLSSHDKLATNLSNVQMLGMLGQVLGPVIGSLLTVYLNWKYIFFINVPLCVVVFITILYALNATIEDKKEINKFDYRGFTYIAIIIISVLYSSLSIGSNLFIYNNQVIFTLVVICAICGVLLHKHVINYRKKLIIDFPLFQQNKLFKIYSLVSFISRQCTGAIYFIILMIFSLIYQVSTIKLSYLLLVLYYMLKWGWTASTKDP